MHHKRHTLACARHPMRALSPCVNESVAVSWHNINYPIKIEWVINCPSLLALITLAEKGHLRGAKKRGEEGRQDGGAKQRPSETHVSLCVYIHIWDCACVCVERVRQVQRGGGGHIGGRIMWFSLRAPRGPVLREKPAYWGEEGRRRDEREMRVLLFILTCSTQSLALASQLRCCGSSAMYTKQRGRTARAHRWWEQRQKIDPAVRMCGALLEDQ